MWKELNLLGLSQDYLTVVLKRNLRVKYGQKKGKSSSKNDSFPALT